MLTTHSANLPFAYQVVIDQMKWNENASIIIENRGLTYADLMPIIGVKTSDAVAQILSGRRNPTPQQLKNLADFLGVTIDDFFTFSAAEPTPLPEELVRAIREQPVKPLGHRYDWSNPGGLRPEVMIYKVLRAERFEDILEACYQYGIDKVYEVFHSMTHFPSSRSSIERTLGNIQYGIEMANTEAKKDNESNL